MTLSRESFNIIYQALCTQGSAMALLHDLNNNTQNLKDKLNIELDQDCRVGKVVYGGLVMPAQVRNCVLYLHYVTWLLLSITEKYVLTIIIININI